jgi:hypothetical protein
MSINYGQTASPQRPIGGYFGPSVVNKTDAATAAHLNLRLGKIAPSHVKTHGWVAGTRIFGKGATTEATTYFQGTANPTGYVRLNPPVTEQAALYASSTMAGSLAPINFHHKQHIPSKPPKSLSKEANPPFLKCYGPSLNKANSAPPEASVFGNGGGQVRTIRAKGTGHIQLSGGL